MKFGTLKRNQNLVFAHSDHFYYVDNLFLLPMFVGKAQQLLDKEIDAHGVLKHLGQVADSMTEWEGRISEELKLTPADVASIHTQHPNKLRLQS